MRAVNVYEHRGEKINDIFGNLKNSSVDHVRNTSFYTGCSHISINPLSINIYIFHILQFGIPMQMHF